MRAFLFVTTLVFGTQTFADSVTCTLSSPRGDETSASIELKDEEYKQSDDSVNAISFTLTVDQCTKKKCVVTSTFDSSEVQDEVGQVSFDVKRGKKPKVNFYQEPVTGENEVNLSFNCSYIP